MEELSDKDFDQIFKNRIKDGYLEYEEESWLKMEKKLRSRDRYVFLRNASIILLFLSFGLGLYLINGEKLTPKEDVKQAKIIKHKKADPIKIENLENDSEILAKVELKNASAIVKIKNKSKRLAKSNSLKSNQETLSNSSNAIVNQSTAVVQNPILSPNENAPEEKTIEASINNTEAGVSAKKSKRSIAFSLLFGPDFSSTENIIGGKSGLSVGFGISIPLSRKWSIQTGVNYGSKNYKAQGYDYSFNNPNVVNLISGIDASCKVLEIPLRSSYLILDNQRNSIDFNAGLSSYLMLKENYRFMYTAASGRKDRFLEEKNANQHYLSVIDLSATYNIKLKNKKFAFGFQPYLKIPLKGIGEGNVPLKSSGISLKLNYLPSMLNR